MANFYVSSVGWTAVAAWQANHVYALNSYVRQAAAVTANNERVFKATSVSGTHTSQGAEPTWVLTAGATTTDNSGANQIIWTEVTGKESEQASNAWNAPAARIAGFPSARLASGDTLFLSQDHAETQASALTINPVSNNIQIICVNRTGTVPPVSADLATTATVSTTLANSITIGGGATRLVYIEGVTFQAGSVGNTGSITLTGNASATGAIHLKNCALVLNNSSNSSVINLGSVSGSGPPNTGVILDNTTITFGAAAQKIAPGNGNHIWKNTPLALNGTVPTSLFLSSPGSVLAAGSILVDGVDLSAATGNIIDVVTSNIKIVFANCKLSASATLISGSPSSEAGQSGCIRFDNCDDTTNGRNYRFSLAMGGGTAQQDAVVVRTGGATDGVTPVSWKITTNASGVTGVSTFWPMILPIAKRYNSITSPASSVTATVYFIANTTTALTNAQIWLEMEALTTSGVPLTAFANDAVADVLSSTSAGSQPTDTSAWDTGASARQNNHAYSVGDIFQVTGTNPGRLFIVTTAGTSATSEPAAYGTAVDGDQITTDRNGGLMVVRCMMRQKLTVAFTPRVQGFVFGRLNIGVPAQTLWIDPKLNIA